MAAFSIDRTQTLLEAYDAKFPINGLLEPQSPGNDTVVVVATIAGFGTLDGGAGTDTLQLDPAAPQTLANGPFGAYSLSVGAFNNPATTTLISFERFVFNSSAGSVMAAQFAYGGNNGALNQIGSGLAANSEIVGGLGNDTLTLRYNNANLPGTVTVPSFTLTNWTTPTRAYLGGDRISISVSGSGATTINGTPHTGVQGLNGGVGSDIINGSDDMDSISGAGGSDQLHGNGGNDTLGLANGYVIINGTVGAESTGTGVGSLFDGGSGTDFLALGGNVNFLGTLQSIEGIFLQAGYTNLNNTGQPINVGSQYYTTVIFSSAAFAALPANLVLDGVGTIRVELGNGGETFTGAGFTFDPGSNVVFDLHGGGGNDTITGTSNADLIFGDLGDDTLFGGAGNDIIQFGTGNQTATGGAGADRFQVGRVRGVVTDFAIGTDKVDFSGTDITNMGRVRDLLSQSVTGATFSADDGGVHYEMVLQGVNAANLVDSDYLLGSPNQGPFNEVGTALQDYLFGGTFNDVLRGGDGNDRIYGGGGVDQLFGDNGDDTLILDGAIAFGGTYDGGAGTDTLVLRPDTTRPAGQGATQYSIFPGAPGTGLVGIERIVFDSSTGSDNSISFVTAFTTAFSGVVGGGGDDVLVLVAQSAGTYTMPAFTLTNWTGSDTLILAAQAGATFAVTLNGRNDVGQYMYGALAGDRLNGGAMADVLYGGGGNDTLVGNGGADRMFGESGDDILNVDLADTVLDGGNGTDMATFVASGTYAGTFSGFEVLEIVPSISVALSAAQFKAGFAADSQLRGASFGGSSLTINMAVTDIELYLQALSVLSGLDLSVIVNGSTSNEIIKGVLGLANTINGGDGNDSIRGGQRADTINGGNGNDKIEGGQGADILTGGAGADVFRYQSANASGIGVAADRIADFVSGTDKLGFLLLDSDPVAPGQQGFSYIDTQAFHGTGAAEVRYGTSGADLLVQLDLNGDAVADMEILLQGLGGQSLASGDFLLNPAAGAQTIFVDSQQSGAFDFVALPPAVIGENGYADTMAFARFDRASGEFVGETHGNDRADFAISHLFFENQLPTGSEFML